MKSRSALRHRAAAATVVVRAMAPGGVVAHQARLEWHQRRKLIADATNGQAHLMQVLMPVRQAARAQGGLEPDWGSTDTMTTAERVAVLDRQLEESTGVFDAIIREEQRQQRESQREQGTKLTQLRWLGTETSSGGRNPYKAAIKVVWLRGRWHGRSLRRRTHAPAVYEAPDDIPSGNDDDIVARQLREAAMREPIPTFVKHYGTNTESKGIEIPEE